MPKVDVDPQEAAGERAHIPIPALGSEGAGATIPLATPPEAGPPAGEAPKRKRGRPAGSKSAPAPAGPVVSPEDMERAKAALSMTFRALGTVLAARRGTHWDFQVEEADTLGSAWAAALAPYLPRIGAAVPWVSAAVITWTVVGPRVETDIRLARQKALSKDNPPAGPELVKV